MSKNRSNMTTIWVGPHAVDAIAIDLVIPIEIIITCDYGSDVLEIEREKTVISLEKRTNVKHIWTNFDVNYLIQDEIQDELLRKLHTKNATIQFVCYSASGLLEQFIENNFAKARNLSLPLNQKLYFDDKILLRQQLQHLGIQTIPAIVTYLGSFTYAKISKILGERLVVKFPVGSAGGRVFYIDSETDFDSIQKEFYSSTVLLESFIEGISINIQGVVSPSKIVLGASSIQIIGPKECTTKKFEWCGNDFYVDEHVSDNLLNQAYNLTGLVANYLKAKGYIGIFGIDLLIDTIEGEVYVLEINPRFQGSTALLTQLEFLNEAPSYLVNHHIGGFYGQESSTNEPCLQKFTSKGCQVILHNNSKDPVLVESTLPSGVYELIDSKLVRCRAGSSLLDCKTSNEFVLSGGVPLKGEIIMPGAPILWIQTFQKALKDPQCRVLSEEVSEICEAIYKKVNFICIDDPSLLN